MTGVQTCALPIYDKRSHEIREEERRNDEQNERIRRETEAHLEACNRREREAREREREAREREREKKREMAAKAKEASEEFNAELGRKGKWPRTPVLAVVRPSSPICLMYF